MGKLTHTISGTTASFRSADKADIENLKVYFNPVQDGTGTPAPDNIRPISGWTGCNIYFTGKNLFNINAPDARPSSTAYENTAKRIFQPYTKIIGASATNYYNTNNKSYAIENDVLTLHSGAGYGIGYAFHLKPGKYYRLSCDITNVLDDGRTCTVSVCSYSKDGTFKKMYEGSVQTFPFLVPNDSDIILISFTMSGSGSGTATYSNIQLEEGREVTAYEPYKGELISLDWSDTAGTVYGGYVDLATGELIEDQNCCTLTGLESYANESADWITVSIPKNSDISVHAKKTGVAGYCSHYSYKTYTRNSIGVMYNTRQIIFDGQIGDASYWKQYCTEQYASGTPVQVAYFLEIPRTYQIDQTALKTLLDRNTIWSNANGNVEATYDIYDRFAHKRRMFMNNNPHTVSMEIPTVRGFNTNMSVPFKECKVHFSAIQEGTDTPSPSNVRPLVGWNGITISQSGKNLLDLPEMPAEGISNDDWGIRNKNIKPVLDSINRTISVTGVSDGMTVLYRKRNIKPGTYCLSYNISGDGVTSSTFKRCLIQCFDYSGNVMDNTAVTISGFTWNTYYQGFYSERMSFTVPDNVAYFWIGFGVVSEISNSTIVFSNIQLELGSTPTAYESSENSITTTIDWTDEAGTVYSGYVDLIKGEVVAEYIGMTKKLSDADSRVVYGTLVQYLFAYFSPLKIINNANQKCSLCPYSWNTTDFKGNHFYAYTATDGDTRALVYFLEDEDPDPNTELTLIVPLETPVIYPIDPTILKPFKGKNVIWSNANGTSELKYWTH